MYLYFVICILYVYIFNKVVFKVICIYAFLYVYMSYIICYMSTIYLIRLIKFIVVYE